MFLLFVAVGFVAQMVDGMLGMGYGVISSSFLLLIGVPPALASSGVHVSKVFANGAAGLSHWRFGNVDKRLLLGLAPAGMLGGVIGAMVIAALPTGVARPFVAIYLFLSGLVILRRALRGTQAEALRASEKRVFPLGFVGGFLDAIGGGGWGPVVTSMLLASGRNPRQAIGSGSLAEFFVALSVSAVFFGKFSLTEQAPIIAGLIVGGVLGAPLAAYLTGRIPARAMMVAVGLLVIVLSVSSL